MVQIKKKVKSILKKTGKKGISVEELRKNFKVNQQKLFKKALIEMQGEGSVVQIQKKMFWSKAIGFIVAEIVRVNQTFGFAKEIQLPHQEYFIPGKFLKGALPHDRVLLKKIPSRGQSLEGQVVSVISAGMPQFAGQLLFENKRFFIQPDQLMRFPIPVILKGEGEAKPGDQVVAKIVKRGNRHQEHAAVVVCSYGASDHAYACADALVASMGISKTFPDTVKAQTIEISRAGIREQDLLGRTDFRDQIVMTIDGADAKDLDDAISIKSLRDGYELCVHIADVSHYVQFDSPLDQEAFRRGTSVYYADQVIPMLPKALSNGLCSLTPHQDRLTMTAILTLDQKGVLRSYKFCKSVICSCQKGVYSEINQLFDGEASKDIVLKYQSIYPTLLLMKELAHQLMYNKKHRGSPEIITSESRIVVGEQRQPVDILPRSMGMAENMIEEFMLLANEAVAMFGQEKQLPLLYRIHEKPDASKVEKLGELLKSLGVESKSLLPDLHPRVFGEILERVNGTTLQAVVNLQVLRTMSKAQYSDQPMGHYGLALKNYAHFTSPIRRYPDLVVHRSVGEWIDGQETSSIQHKYGKYLKKAAKECSQAEMNAVQAERKCQDFYKAEYMKRHIGMTFEGVISSVAPHGIYVTLNNTVEGMISIDSLPQGQYDYDGVMCYHNRTTGQRYRIGDTACIICVASTVQTGRIDFALVTTHESDFS